MKVASECCYEDKHDMHEAFLSIYRDIQQFEMCVHLIVFITYTNPKGLKFVSRLKFIIIYYL